MEKFEKVLKSGVISGRHGENKAHGKKGVERERDELLHL
jgi:hypothetical protein